MRFRLTILVILTWGFCLQVTAQNTTEVPYHPNSYHLLLPEVWLKPKLIKAITDILPQTLDQVKGRDFCTSCRADYTAMLIIDSISYASGGNITTIINPILETFPDVEYGVVSFYAAIRLFDSTGKAVIDLQLIGTEEDMTASNPWELRMQQIQPSAPYDIELIRTMHGTTTYLRNTSLYNNLPSTPVYRRSYNGNSISFMGVCEKRIYQIRRWLRHLVNTNPA